MVTTEDLAFAFMPLLHEASSSFVGGGLSPLKTAKTISVIDLDEKRDSHIEPIPGVVRSEWQLDSKARNLASRDWIPLSAWRSTISKIESAKIKFVRGTVRGEKFTGEYKLATKAKRHDGSVSSLKANLHLEFQRLANISDELDPSSWQLSTWMVIDSVEDVGQPMFQIVTEQAIPDADTLAAAQRSWPKEIIVGLLTKGTARTNHPRLALFPDFRNTYQTPGLSIVDIDDDGWQDVYLVGKGPHPNLLLRNNQDGTFTDIASTIGLGIEGYSNAALFADFDNDGDQDVFVGRTVERTQFLENVDGTFVDRSSEVFPEGLPYLVSSISAADFDNDGLLDVYFATYGPRVKSPKRLQEAIRAFEFSGPLERRLHQRFRQQHGYLDAIGPPNLLLRNTGGGFERAPENTDLDRMRNAYACSWSDFDGDGDQDLYVANDYAPDELYRNNGDTDDLGHRFEEVSKSISGDTMNGFGMGVSWGDYDENGTIDLYVSNMFSKAGRRITAQLDGLDDRIPYAAQGSLLFRQSKEGRFSQVAQKMRVHSVGWSYGGIFCDVDNDGRLDIYSASGYYTPPPELDSHCDT